jgi:hypothetical protein
MALAQSNPAAIGIGTALNSLATGVWAQSSEVTPGWTNNVNELIASWALTIGTITASASTVVNVYAWGTVDDAGYPGSNTGSDIITGTAGSFAKSANGTVLTFVKSCVAHTTGMILRDEVEISGILGFKPRRFGLVFNNVTGANLAASGHSAEWVFNYYN